MFLSILVCNGKQLLHQPLFVGFEGGDLFGLGGDECVEGAETVGDFLLFFWQWN